MLTAPTSVGAVSFWFGLMCLDANQIDKAFYEALKKNWSEAQIMELGAFIAVRYGMQMFMRSLGAKAAG
jgi:hypothetical protein